MSTDHQDFDYDAIDGVEPEPEPQQTNAEAVFNQRFVVCWLLDLLTGGTDAKGAGQRAFILAHELKAGTCHRKQDLAAKLGISPGRLSQVLKCLRREIVRLNAVKTDADTLAH